MGGPKDPTRKKIQKILQENTFYIYHREDELQ